jgi:hypothetical protein
MERVLDLYHQPYDPCYPVVCFDEANKLLFASKLDPLAAAAGRPARYDYSFEPRGSRNLFLFCEPLRGWREVQVTTQRTKLDFARCLQTLVEVHYPHATQIRLVLDNLNTHRPAVLYELLPPQEAKRLLARLDFYYTPKHGSWLNMAEIEFSILTRQGLEARIPDEATLQAQVAAWVHARNQAPAIIDWQFTTDEARIKLKRLYPSF